MAYSLNTRLQVYYIDGDADEDANSFDYSDYFFRFDTDARSITVKSNDQILIGFARPLNALYVDMEDFTGTSDTAQFQYNDGTGDSGWHDMPNIDDGTNGMVRAGMIQWNRNPGTASINSDASEFFRPEGTDDPEVKVKYFERTGFWYRIVIEDTTTAERKINAINLLFSDDSDLERFYAGITSTLRVNQTYVLQHVAARDSILRDIEKRGLRKIDYGDGTPKRYNQFDLFEIPEVRDASAAHALSNIFFQKSNGQNDHFWSLAELYRQKYIEYLNQGYLSLDEDNDGKEEFYEKEDTTNLGSIRFGK